MLWQEPLYFYWRQPITDKTAFFRYGGSLPAKITEVEIVCRQSTAKGEASIVKGGIGSRFVSIQIFVPKTNYVDCYCRIYGQMSFCLSNLREFYLKTV